MLGLVYKDFVDFILKLKMIQGTLFYYIAINVKLSVHAQHNTPPCVVIINKNRYDKPTHPNKANGKRQRGKKETFQSVKNYFIWFLVL